MMGIDPVEQRRMMVESSRRFPALFRGAAPDERIDRHSDWFTCVKRNCTSAPTIWPYPRNRYRSHDFAIGSATGRCVGTSLLSLSMPVLGGYAALETAGAWRSRPPKLGGRAGSR